MPFDRGFFGNWGVELSRDDFACALAALGVIGADALRRPECPSAVELLRRRLSNGEPVRWSFTGSAAQLDGVSAPVLAAAWGEAVEWPGVRLELRDTPASDPFWLF